MKVKIKRPQEIEIASVTITIPVRYEDDDMPYDFPLRDGDQWSATVNIDTGEIAGWPQGKTGDIYMKVCDNGIYTLHGAHGETIATRNDYVPHGVIPGEYGDYVSLQINDKGIITNWPKNPDVAEFFPDGDCDD